MKSTKKIINEISSLGRRKEAVARVRLRDGSGKIYVNRQQIDNYFPSKYVVAEVMEPFELTNTKQKFDVIATIRGGGFAAQADALKLAISKALVTGEESMRPGLRKSGLLTTDARTKERKKYGLKKARKASQFSKR